MARVAATGAEVNSLNELDTVSIGGSGGVRTFDTSTTQKRSGARSWRVEQTGAPTSPGAVYGQINTPASGTGCVRFSVYVDQDNNESGNLVALMTIINSTLGEGILFGRSDNDPTNWQWRIGFITGAGLVQNVATVLMIPFADALYRWHEVYIRWTITSGTAASKIVTCSVNGSPEVSTSAPAAITATTVNRVRFGSSPAPDLAQSAPNDILYFDDIIVDDANAAISHSSNILLFQPNGVNSGTWVGVGVGTKDALVVDKNNATGISASAVSEGQNFEATNLALDGQPAKVVAIYGGFRHGTVPEVATDTVRMYLVDAALAILATSTFRTGSLTSVNENNVFAYPWTANGKTLAALETAGLGVQNGSGAVRGIFVQEVWANVEVAFTSALPDTSTETPSMSSTKAAAALTDSSVETSSLAVKASVNLDDQSTLAAEALAVKVSAALADVITATEVVQVKVSAALLDQAPSTPSLVVAAISIALTDAGLMTDGVTITARSALTDTSTETPDIYKQVYIVEGLAGGVSQTVIFGVFD